MALKVGDRVRLSPKSPYYGFFGQIPHDTVATLIGINEHREHSYRVEWPTRKGMVINVYRENDLILAHEHFTESLDEWM